MSYGCKDESGQKWIRVASFQKWIQQGKTGRPPDVTGRRFPIISAVILAAPLQAYRETGFGEVLKVTVSDYKEAEGILRTSSLEL